MPMIEGYNPAPGPQQVSKYPFVGNNYKIHGEQRGFIYDPYSDTYYQDPRVKQQQYQNEGLIDKPAKAPGLLSSLAPLAVAAGVPAIASEGGKYIGGLFNLGKGADAASKASEAAKVVNSGATAANEINSGANALASAGQTGQYIYDSAGNAIGSAAPNASMLSDGVAESAPGGLFTVGSTAGNIAGGLGIAGGAYGAYEGIKSGNPLTAGMGGMSAVLGANQLGYALGPYGIAASIAVPALIALANKMGDKDMWKTEQKRLQKLREQGIFVPDSVMNSMPSRGRSKDELIQIAQQTGGNVQFAGSRNESDLQPQDLVGYASIIEQAAKTGKDPMQLASEALAANAVREHHGTIDVDWSKVGQSQQQPQQQAAQAAISQMAAKPTDSAVGQQAKIDPGFLQTAAANAVNLPGVVPSGMTMADANQAAKFIANSGMRRGRGLLNL